MFKENFSVIFVFILFQLSFRASIEVSILYVSFKQFFFLTSSFISSIGFHNLSMRGNIVISQKIYQRDSKLKVAGFFSICHSVFLTNFLIFSLVYQVVIVEYIVTSRYFFQRDSKLKVAGLYSICHIDFSAGPWTKSYVSSTNELMCRQKP